MMGLGCSWPASEAVRRKGLLYGASLPFPRCFPVDGSPSLLPTAPPTPFSSHQITSFPPNSFLSPNYQITVSCLSYEGVAHPLIEPEKNKLGTRKCGCPLNASISVWVTVTSVWEPPALSV